MKDLIAAIDLGTTKVVAVVGEKTNLGVKVVAYGEAPSRGIKRGRIENVKFAHQALEKALRKVEEQINMKVRKAFVGIAGQDIKCISPEPFQIQIAGVLEIHGREGKPILFHPRQEDIHIRQVHIPVGFR